MPKLAVLALAVPVLAACASTTGWRALRIDATSESSFEESIALFQRELPYNRRVLFDFSLENLGARLVTPEVFKRLDGLGYEEVVDLAGPGARSKYNNHYPRPLIGTPLTTPAGFTYLGVVPPQRR